MICTVSRKKKRKATYHGFKSKKQWRGHPEHNGEDYRRNPNYSEGVVA